MESFYRGVIDTVCCGPFLASGYRAGSAHSSFNGRVIEAGETVFLEVTAEVRRYTAPLMRTAILGRPTAEQERIAEAGAAAVETIMATARPGVAAADVARAAGEVLGASVLRQPSCRQRFCRQRDEKEGPDARSETSSRRSEAARAVFAGGHRQRPPDLHREPGSPRSCDRQGAARRDPGRSAAGAV